MCEYVSESVSNVHARTCYSVQSLSTVMGQSSPHGYSSGSPKGRVGIKESVRQS